MKWKKYLEETVDPDDVDIKSVAVKDELDPVIWDDKQSLKSYLADHLYKSAFVVDKEINAFACLVNLENALD